MQAKKSHKADLERKRAIFLQLGLIVSSIIVLVLLEWRTPVNNSAVVYRIDDIEMETDLQPIERAQEIKPPMPQKYSKLTVIDDNNEINEDFELLSPEIEPYEAVPITELSLKKENDDEVATVWIAPTMPKFPGGKIGLQQYIANHLKYPEKAINDNIQGKVFVRFVVNDKGIVEQISVLNKVHPLLDKEALRIVNSLPKWQAGTQNGKAVKVCLTIPIVFKL